MHKEVKNKIKLLNQSTKHAALLAAADLAEGSDNDSAGNEGHVGVAKKKKGSISRKRKAMANSGAGAMGLGVKTNNFMDN